MGWYWATHWLLLLVPLGFLSLVKAPGPGRVVAKVSVARRPWWASWHCLCICGVLGKSLELRASISSPRKRMLVAPSSFGMLRE